MRVLLTFASIHYVLKAEKLLKAQGIPLDMVPVPKEISSDCGMALVLPEKDLSKAQKALGDKLRPEGIYPYP